ncbi:NFX1-type zinc finger-containing protein 1-like isoform X2 [Tribolium madens]|uniref:NFX1-type zinc finger-containing protein 1-like isoform X2 n=1 Tax=Tribolium madens TaxID=41895 RepID=UPI001CF7663A|nr:NFX1-type zinc finger-containing protein 1-like isoform X2 [Tribolium madens]
MNPEESKRKREAPTGAIHNWRNFTDTGTSSFFGNRSKETGSKTNQPRRFEGKQIKSMGFRFLEDLLKNDPERIILALMKEREAILRKVCSSSFDETKYSVLHSTLNEKFTNKIKTFIACLPTQDKFQRRTSSFFWKDPGEFWSNLTHICEDLLNTTPTFACKNLPVLLNAIKIYAPIIEQEQQTEVSDEIKSKVEKMLQVIKTLKESEEKEKLKQDEAVDTNQPPDDFRQISVYPTPAEIVGGRGFLRENIVKGPYQNVNHYLDVQFRLLREDFVGPLRDGINNYRSSTPSNEIENVKIHKDVYFLKTETINEFYCLRIQFRSKKKKKINFEQSKRFIFGSLLCFTKDNFQTLIFGRVAQRKIEDLENGQVIVAFDNKIKVDFSAAYLMVECSVYFEPYFHVLTVLKNMTEEMFPMERYIIRVNPSVQPPAYLTAPNCKLEIEDHTFNPLSEWPDEDFYGLNDSQMVAFKAAITQEIAVIQGPPGTGKTYLGLKIAQTQLENTECWYNYTPMLVICFTNHALDQFLEGLLPFTREIIRVGGRSQNEKLDAYNLRNKTQRDSSVAQQRFEVQRCLREIKQITEHLNQIEYYNRVLSIRTFADVIPDFPETWFQRASNQQVVHWLMEGANYGQDLSNIIDNLQVLQAQEEMNRIGINDDVEDIGDVFNEHIHTILDSVFDVSVVSNKDDYIITLESMRNHLRQYEDKLFKLRQIQNPSFQELIREEELHFQMQDLRQKYEYVKHQLVDWRNLQGEIEPPQNADLLNPYNMGFEDRWKLYFYWLNLHKQRESDVLKMVCEDFPTIYKEYEVMREMEDVQVMKKALVVGMTTTSAARLRSSLQTLKSPIVIVEEAAEVLEAHIVTSITKHCQHLILIGDHKQLKPNTANYSMEKQYHLGISLFERMIRNNIHCYTLNVQHRMRPEISSLIRPTIYDFLEDHPSVYNRPKISGIDNCVFFIDHTHPEEQCDGSSKTNLHEVSFFIYLARHLILNGYNPANITILAAYLGQFFAFQKEKKVHKDLLKDVRIAVLDNYQGEESDIILLSLVRNNNENKIGFLKIENRVCVALSRARNGLYIMGNMTQLCFENKLWRKIKASLEQQKALGNELPLRCQIHQDQVTFVKSESDFYSVSEGGCSKKCGAELKCGHNCNSLCHIRDRNHMIYKCQAACKKNLCNKDPTHICKKMCFEECAPCNYLVHRTLACGHDASIQCHIDPEAYKCEILVSTELPCGHITDKPCFSDPVTFRCPHICDVQVQPCGHACELFCHIRKDPDHLEYKCKKPCTRYMKRCTVNDEDHKCKKMCYQDCDVCTVTVRKKRTLCNHYYDVRCCDDVDDIDCEKPCSKVQKCGHPCKRRCNEPCQVCQIKVSKIHPVCNHPVKVKCCEKPDRKYCNKDCPLILPCGHPCTKKCNEPCTTACSVLVDCSGIQAECGHLVTRMECHMVTSSVDPKRLIQYCNAPCNRELKCGHLCSGSCGECFQGRIHKRCSEKCGAPLVCDHLCDIPCRQACRPCRRVCSYTCGHSICKKKCGEVCTPCKEPCLRNCRHQWCTKLCGEPCNVPPCTEPCKKVLKCGHLCIGFCGDPCPPKCLVCDKEELLEVFFGTESEDARYVLLKDCKHIVENEGMEHWLRQNEFQISYKLCPMCKTAIKTTQRYQDYIKMAIKDVAQVKFKANGSPAEIREKTDKIKTSLQVLETKCRILKMYYPPITDVLRTFRSRIQQSNKGKRQHLNIFDVQSLMAKLQITEHIANICCNEKVVVETIHEIFFPQVTLIVGVLMRDVDITNQEISDLNYEINRLSRIVDFSCVQKTSQFPHYKANNETAKSLISTIEKQLFSCQKFTNEINDLLKDCLRELNDIMKSGLAISDQERREILQAMGFSKGHWYKCPNGHVYAIGECGGAMEEATCNECGARIGGSRHRLLESNDVATEMDGATHGAWGMAANLRNYEL